jgi:hypothetical protein
MEIVATEMQNEKKKSRRLQELSRIDSWLIRLHQRSPLKFWLLALVVGILFPILLFGLSAFLGWLTR